MNPTPTTIERELYSIYTEQFDRYWSWFEQKNYGYYQYALLSCEHILYTMVTYMEKSEKVRLLIAQYEGLIAMLKLEMQKDTWQNTDFSLKSPQRFSKSAYKNNKKKYIS